MEPKSNVVDIIGNTLITCMVLDDGDLKPSSADCICTSMEEKNFLQFVPLESCKRPDPEHPKVSLTLSSLSDGSEHPNSLRSATLKSDQPPCSACAPPVLRHLSPVADHQLLY
ncbi:hypothetical protein E3N88_21410 [Mikania micrantha]|uniref:Uncharacterized protein n=1 Tax=Mikania micrantha TaxID=192012 RepID=A0A5N6NMK5_9ASTR|nr:hypothetical protein E3N88_21410 [Mikania micrantha]